MYKHDLLNHPVTQCHVIVVLWLAEHNTELISKVLQTLVAGVQVKHLETPQQQFHSVRQESIFVVLHDDTLEDLAVRRANQSFENKHDGNHVFLLSPAEP